MGRFFRGNFSLFETREYIICRKVVNVHELRIGICVSLIMFQNEARVMAKTHSVSVSR